MTQTNLCNLIHQYAIDYTKYAVELVLTDPNSSTQPKPPLNPCGLLYETIEQRLCNNCIYNYCSCSVQDSILQVDPEATFDTFGCNSFVLKDTK